MHRLQLTRTNPAKVELQRTCHAIEFLSHSLGSRTRTHMAAPYLNERSKTARAIHAICHLACDNQHSSMLFIKGNEHLSLGGHQHNDEVSAQDLDCSSLLTTSIWRIYSDGVDRII